MPALGRDEGSNCQNDLDDIGTGNEVSSICSFKMTF